MNATQKVVAGNLRTYTGPGSLTAGTGLIQGASDGVAALPAGAGQQCIGIITDSDLIGRGTYALARAGEAIAQCGAAIAAPAYVKMDANGHFVPSTAQGDYVYGRAVSSTANAGDMFVIEIGQFIR